MMGQLVAALGRALQVALGLALTLVVVAGLLLALGLAALAELRPRRRA